MPEWGHLPIPAKLLKAGVKDMVRLSDARISGTSFGTIVVHISPEAALGGALAIVQDGDEIELDVSGKSLELLLPEAEIKARLARWTPPAPHYSRGYGKMFLDQFYRRRTVVTSISCAAATAVGTRARCRSSPTRRFERALQGAAANVAMLTDPSVLSHHAIVYNERHSRNLLTRPATAVAPGFSPACRPPQARGRRYDRLRGPPSPKGVSMSHIFGWTPGPRRVCSFGAQDRSPTTHPSVGRGELHLRLRPLRGQKRR